MKLSTTLLAFIAPVFVMLSSCGKEPEAPAHKPREAPAFDPPPVIAPAAPAPAIAPDVPPSPAPTTSEAVAPGANADGEDLALTPPAGWIEQPPRAMITRLFTVPKVEGDDSDAEATVSFLTAKVPLKMNIDRWCGQFALPDPKACADQAPQRTMPDTKYPTTIVELAGAFKGSMIQQQGPAKPGYRMLVAEIVTPGKHWYIKFVGPEKTVRHWQASFDDFVSSAK